MKYHIGPLFPCRIDHFHFFSFAKAAAKSQGVTRLLRAQVVPTALLCAVKLGQRPSKTAKATFSGSQMVSDSAPAEHSLTSSDATGSSSIALVSYILLVLTASDAFRCSTTGIPYSNKILMVLSGAVPRDRSVDTRQD
jgi:hypothetical protein